MSEKSHIQTAYFKMHLAVILFGFTAILGGLIALPAISIVWWRVFITSISIMLFVNIKKSIALIPKKDIAMIMFIGGIIGIHWITFYGAVKLSNASICLVCMSTTSVFTSIIEPVINRTKIYLFDLIVGLVVIIAMSIIVNTLDFKYFWGVVSGLSSAILAAIFSTLNKKYIGVTDAFTITFIELSSACVLIGLLLLIMFGFNMSDVKFLPSTSDLFYLVILALLCTTFAHVLSLQSLKFISAFDASLIMNLEPVYGIVLAALILNEYSDLNISFYIGSLLIILLALTYPTLKSKFYHSKTIF